jgi:predicted RNase H-like HicB family nuclease
MIGGKTRVRRWVRRFPFAQMPGLVPLASLPLERPQRKCLLENSSCPCYPGIVGSEWRSRMITEYIQAALAKAKYEIIDDEEPYYGEIPELDGVWAAAKTLEECRRSLAEVVDGWLVVRLKRGLSIPPIGEHSVEELKRLPVSG